MIGQIILVAIVVGWWLAGASAFAAAWTIELLVHILLTAGI